MNKWEIIIMLLMEEVRILVITPCLVHIGSNSGDKIDHILGPS